jgi:hypothetical protein
MNQQATKPIQGVWPLPGGNDRYLNTLDQTLKWIVSTPQPTRNSLRDWFMNQYNVGENSVTGYLQVIFKLGVISVQEGETLTLSEMGKAVIDGEGAAKAKPVIERFMKDYLAFPEVLAVFASTKEAVHIKSVTAALQPQFPQWTTPVQFEYRVTWLLSLGCLQQVQGRNYAITDFGRSIATQFKVGPVSHPPAKPATEVPVKPVEVMPPTQTQKLIADLKLAAIDSKNPEHLETAVANAFAFLGFSVDQLGESGDTDVLVRANIGHESYAVVVDAKARQDGKLQDLDALTLQEHLNKNEANFAAVVAGSFAGGKVVHHALSNGVVLISVPVLAEWLCLHERTPLNLNEYRAVFATSGLMNSIPAAVKAAAERQEHWAALLVDLVELLRETYQHGLSESFSASQLFAMLVTRLHGVRHSSQEVRDAVALLTHPAICGALGTADTGISLALDLDTLARKLRALADQLEKTEPETA